MRTWQVAVDEELEPVLVERPARAIRVRTADEALDEVHRRTLSRARCCTRRGLWSCWAGQSASGGESSAESAAAVVASSCRLRLHSSGSRSRASRRSEHSDAVERAPNESV